MARASTQCVALPNIVDLDSLDSIRDTMLDAIERGPVVVDAAAVERVATNALLMLLSAAESARRSAFAFVIDKPSSQMQSAIQRLGLGPSFEPLTRG